MWELAVVVAVLVGYAWLAALSARVRALSRRLARHVCEEPDARWSRRPAEKVVRRERGTPGRALSPTVRRAPAEVTSPLAVYVDDQEGEEGWR